MKQYVKFPWNLNLFFVYGWGFEHGQGFNNPIWSVTIEIIAYAIFWISIKKIFKYGFLISFFIIFLTILLMYLKINNLYVILECIFFFFVGVSCFIFNQKNINLNIKLLIYIFFFIIFFYAIHYNQDKFFLLGIPSLFIIIFLFFAYCENFFDKYFRNICIWLGNISYGSYLWHIPIQIMILTFFDYLGLDNHIFLYSFSLLSYIILVLIISHYSFLYIESPLRKKIQLFKK